MKNVENRFPRISSSLQNETEVGKKDSGKIVKSTFVWPSGATYTGDVFNGRRCGKGKQTWPNGSTYEGEFFDDMRHGNGKNKWASGEEYEGEFFKDHRHGEGVYRWPDGSEYHGTFYLGRKEGYGKLIFANGDSFEGLHKKDERCGPGIVSYNKSKAQDIGLWYKEKLIRLCSEVDDIFTIKDHPEYQYYPEEHLSQMTLTDEEKRDALQLMLMEKSLTYTESNLQSVLYMDENFLPEGIEHYCRDFEHLPVTTSFREALDKAFYKDNFHLVQSDENAFLFARNNTALLMDAQRQMYRHRHVAESFSAKVSIVDGAPREIFQSKQGPLEKMSEKLIIAAAGGDGKTVYSILKSRLVNPNVCDTTGNTPLLGAAINCHSQIVNLLLDMGANIDQVNDEGVTALNACHIFYYPSDHFKPNIAEKYVQEHMSGKMKATLPLPIEDKAKSTRKQLSANSRPQSPLLYDDRLKGLKRRGSLSKSTRDRRGSVSSMKSTHSSSSSTISDAVEQERKSAIECCKSDVKIKARFRQLSSAKHDTRQKKKAQREQESPSVREEDEGSICSGHSFQSTSVDSTMASKKNLIEFYMDVPEDLIERTATLLSTNRRAVSGISTRDGQAISLGTAGALAVWKAEHEELRHMIELLLQRGASPNKSAVPMPPLFFAVKAGDTDAIRLLLLKGASTETRLSSLLGGFTPMHIASAIPGKDGVLAVRLLLQAGGNPNAAAHDEEISHDKTTLSGSCVSSDYSVPVKKTSTSQWLSDGLKEVEEGGRTPLHIACDRDDDYKYASEVVHELLDNGADPDVIWSGHSPLSLAIASGNDLAIDELLSFGADASMPLKRGVGSALCAAANTEYEHRRTADDRIKLVDKLVNAGASMLAPIVFGTKQVTGTVVDYAHWMFGKDGRIAHTPYHALSYHERDTYNARKRLLAHFGNLLREAAVKVEREKLKGETKFGVRTQSLSRSERFLYIGAGAKLSAVPVSTSPQLVHSAQIPASHVSFPDRTLPEDRPVSKISSIITEEETELKPVKVKVIKGRSGSGPIRKPLFRYCYECGRSVGVRLTTCSRCREVYYCSRSCKLKAWEDRHKNECLRVKGNRDMSSPPPAEIASYFTVHTLKEAMSNDPLVDSVKILPKSIVRNTDFLPISKSETALSTRYKHSRAKARKKTASSRSTSIPNLGAKRPPHRKVHIGKAMQTRVGKEAFFGTTGMTLAELGIEENYSFE